VLPMTQAEKFEAIGIRAPKGTYLCTFTTYMLIL
jgi:ATP-dependent 26S proteasome regulatory subunit